MKWIAGVVLSFFLVSAHAGPVEDSLPDPTGMFVRGNAPVCDSEEQMRAVWEAHKAGGLKAGNARFMELTRIMSASGEPACGMLEGQFFVLAVLDTAWLQYDHRELWSVLVEIIHMSGRRFYAVLSNSGVTRSQAGT